MRLIMPEKKILIAGSNGFLGSNLVRYFSRIPDFQVYATSHRPNEISGITEFYRGDLLDDSFVETIFAKIRPDIVINTVSLVNLDLCEEQPSLSHQTTVVTAENIAKAAQRQESRLIYISTDHLFEGTRQLYTEEDVPSPINVYGRTKRIAEEKCLLFSRSPSIIRTNFFGWSPAGHVQTFGEWVYSSLIEQKPMNLFNDYYFTPIEVTCLAMALEEVIRSSFSGILNIVGSERCSKYKFGMELASVFGLDPSPIHECTVSTAMFRAPRQKDLSLSTRKFSEVFHHDLPGLRESLVRFRETRR